VSYAELNQEPGKRFAGFAAVLLFHVVLGYALVNGLARKIVEVVKAPLETKIIEEIKPPPDKPPPPPPPRLKTPPPPYIPPPEVQVQLPAAIQTTAITAVTRTKPSEPVVAPRVVKQPVHSPPVVDANACDKPEYPAAALRAQETGIVRLAFLIDVDGSVLESRVEGSSGFRRLDDAARKALGLCKFRPATNDGKAERAWAKIEYEWKMTD
jgi:periplasmic protein TonB